MKKNNLIKKSKNNFFKRNKLLLIGIVAVLGYYSYHMYQTENKLDEYKAVQKELKNEIAFIERDIDKLEDEYIYSQSTEAVEKIAREKLKMVKPNEIIFLIKGKEEGGSN